MVSILILDSKNYSHALRKSKLFQKDLFTIEEAKKLSVLLLLYR
ncbi:hypothetical protein LKF24_2021 [Lactococcus lactis subsp. lactis]|nr:hypothetical protein LKF24_2021 [Lactococcus lactis subsp. lactis]